MKLMPVSQNCNRILTLVNDLDSQLMDQIWNFYVGHLILIVFALFGGTILGLFAIDVIRIKFPRIGDLALLTWVTLSLASIFVATFTPVANSQPTQFRLETLQGLFASQSSGGTWRALTHASGEWQDPVGNVLLFIPISVALTALVGGIPTRISLLTLTISIEIGQFVIGSGRTAELIDIALNYAGVEIGLQLVGLVRRKTFYQK